ncbi:MAG: aspartate carbamoyltransferase catalytic subunit [candidate division Zixibacteria bacterium]|nr:aspartate carbamoyltransferase catalytic subunit [candidate division Zixibacteria bacterium]
MPSDFKHLLGLEGMPAAQITRILNTAETFRDILERPIKRVPTLRGATIVNLFYESSTRTRISFELAEKRMSADTVNFSTDASSVKKGETLKDTVRNLAAMRIDMVVIRHKSAGTPLFLTRFLDASVINAGDGAHEHPTQALLDMYTLRKKYGKLKGLKVAIIGDIRHSRVARSNIWGLKSMGANVTICGPTTLLPWEIEKMGVKVHNRLESALEGSDVAMVLRIQLERQQSCYFPTLREYSQLYGLTEERIRLLNPNFTIMHPGPMNRGVEISQEVADGPYSVILDQVTNGVAVRMAVLYLLSGGEGKVDEAV